jgi:hypothetical protein
VIGRIDVIFTVSHKLGHFGLRVLIAHLRPSAVLSRYTDFLDKRCAAFLLLNWQIKYFTRFFQRRWKPVAVNQGYGVYPLVKKRRRKTILTAYMLPNIEVKECIMRVYLMQASC